MSDNVIHRLNGVILERGSKREENSYTCYLFEKGVDKILKKCGEECAEMIIAAKNGDKHELKNEIADLMYHILVLCADRGLEWGEVEDVLAERGNKTNNLKQSRETDKNS
ncbi:MAG: phosphoribosyl-ATP diphosphatase [Oscillospiraceae bacterium]|jgi:phosphoribosyl-ATP pyrophosphohydrolase|nr:phosphoribosyl-ATP diphosphatase [Oscillospiraceae bacterium]